MTHEGRAPVLVTGGTGQIGRVVIDELLQAGVPVRALTRGPADMPAPVEVVQGDLTVPESLDPALQGVSAVFLVWTIPFETAPAVIDRLAEHAQRVVLLSAPHRTPHPFFQQPNPMAGLLADLEQLIAEAGVASTIIRPGMFFTNTLNWWAPSIRAGDVVRWPYAAAERHRWTSATSRQWRHGRSTRTGTRAATMSSPALRR